MCVCMGDWVFITASPDAETSAMFFFADKKREREWTLLSGRCSLVAYTGKQ
jgi:hypothetical protein